MRRVRGEDGNQILAGTARSVTDGVLNWQVYHELEKQLLDYPAGPHTHSRIERRPVWERLWCRFVLRWSFPYWREKIVAYKCSGEVGSGGEIKFRSEFDTEYFGRKVVAWRQWECLNPSIPDSTMGGALILYAAVRIPEGWSIQVPRSQTP